MKEFIEIKKDLEKLFSNKIIVKNMLIYSYYDKYFLKLLKEYVFVFINKNSIEIKEKLFKKIRRKCIEALNNLNNEKNCINILSLESYFSLIEHIMEKSNYYENVIELFKTKYKKDYLNVLKSLENKTFTKKMTNLENEYLFILKWQSSQNDFGHLFVEKALKKVKIKNASLESYFINDLYIKRLIDMDLVSKIIIFLEKEKVLSLIGGKGYGLGMLYLNELKIPKTYVLLNKSIIKKSDFNLLCDDKFYSVRSSGTIEDGKEISLAGMFDSYLNIEKKDVVKHVTKVKDSINNKRVKKYLKVKKIKNIGMSVIIEEFVEPEYSGVWFNINEDEGIYEFVSGNGEKLVSGKVNSTKVECLKNKKEEKLENIDLKKEFINASKKLNDLCDIEWCIINQQLYFLQYRPITKKINITKQIKVKNNDKTIIGLGVSEGKLEGKIQYISDIKYKNKFKKGNILLTESTDILWAEIIDMANGMITKNGSLLCHAAIIAREKGIPCITNLDDKSFDKLKETKKIKMDGEKGTIEIG